MMKRKKIGMLFCLGLLLAITGTATVRSLAVQARVYTAPLVVIDPGHGGFDPGAIGMDTKVEECEINLAIAKLLKAELEQHGYRVLMTREEDKALAHTKKADMQARRDMIGQSGADLVLSIHQNSNPDRSANGAMVLYYKESEEGQRIAQAVQERLNGALKSEKMRDAVPQTDKYILKSGEMPILIVECGFLSNSREEGILRSEEGQQALALAIAEGVCQTLPIAGTTP